MNEFILPAWSTEKRLKTTILLSLFIGLCSLFMGIGFFQTSLGKELIHKPVNRQTIMEMLSKDSEFVKTVRQKAREKECLNQSVNLRAAYSTPLHPDWSNEKDTCTRFYTTHPTGSRINIHIDFSNDSKEKIVADEIKQFRYVETELLAYANRNMSKIAGVIKDIPTTIYVIDLNSKRAVVTYAPTSPVSDQAVVNLVNSLTID